MPPYPRFFYPFLPTTLNTLLLCASHAIQSSHIRRGHPIFFGLITFFAIIEGIITAWLVSKFNNNDTYPSNSYRDRLKFLVFVSWWTVVFGAAHLTSFLVASTNFVSSIATHLGVWALTWLFWLAGAASFTAALGGGARCSHSSLTYCSQLVAAEAFAWIEWILLSVLFIFLLLIAVMALRRGDSLGGGLV
ncbi:hypothetical protein B9479_001949 [Cryptococcus floricola]|uniref:MARVEL domain-containing protein n=1 Tax=Cryptococcus floricola TaxID=2591691 RepID=A0A5D3B451_9TREE|nr:hypothetical protein B9479_001949 [Cryptococcus floricola]